MGDLVVVGRVVMVGNRVGEGMEDAALSENERVRIGERMGELELIRRVLRWCGWHMRLSSGLVLSPK